MVNARGKIANVNERVGRVRVKAIISLETKFVYKERKSVANRGSRSIVRLHVISMERKKNVRGKEEIRVIPVRGFGERVSRQETQWISYTQNSSFHREGTQRCICRKKQRLLRARASRRLFLPVFLLRSFFSLCSIYFLWLETTIRDAQKTEKVANNRRRRLSGCRAKAYRGGRRIGSSEFGDGELSRRCIKRMWSNGWTRMTIIYAYNIGS